MKGQIISKTEALECLRSAAVQVKNSAKPSTWSWGLLSNNVKAFFSFPNCNISWFFVQLSGGLSSWIYSHNISVQGYIQRTHFYVTA